MKKKINTSTWMLVFVNLVAIGLVVFEKWSLLTLMFVYFVQSLIIGFFNIFRIFSLKKNVLRVKVFAAVFFILIFYGVHFYLWGFLEDYDFFEWRGVLLGSGLFFVNHLFSFWKHRAEKDKRDFVGVMLFPFVRVWPMFLAVIFLAFCGDVVLWIVVFGVLKSIVDVAMHFVEHS
ncbi:MAG: hypothetical protein KJ718_05855 [Nanoarchaeota archaeon]|nr:hypothetical protein [Nanoarchaeota archaeon]